MLKKPSPKDRYDVAAGEATYRSGKVGDSDGWHFDGTVTDTKEDLVSRKLDSRGAENTFQIYDSKSRPVRAGDSFNFFFLSLSL